MSEKKFSDLSFKDKVAYITAIASFILGWLLICAGFIADPLGEISAGVLTAFGSALVYTASVLGISLYFANELSTFKRTVGRHMLDNEPRLRRTYLNEYQDDIPDE